MFRPLSQSSQFEHTPHTQVDLTCSKQTKRRGKNHSTLWSTAQIRLDVVAFQSSAYMAVDTSDTQNLIFLCSSFWAWVRHYIIWPNPTSWPKSILHHALASFKAKWNGKSWLVQIYNTCSVSKLGLVKSVWTHTHICNFDLTCPKQIKRRKKTTILMLYHSMASSRTKWNSKSWLVPAGYIYILVVCSRVDLTCPEPGYYRYL